MSVMKRISDLQDLTVKDLQAKYTELFGEPTRSANKPWLIKRLAWRMQSRLEGTLSERAKRRAAELADDSDLRMKPPKESDTVVEPTAPADDRLPIPGTVLPRLYKGRTYHVTILEDGCEYEGDHYRSLSAVAKNITGQHVNGFAFFGLTKEKAQ